MEGKPMSKVRFALTLEDVAHAGDVPATVRLRALLKRLLRNHAFKVIQVAEVNPGPDGKGPADAVVGPRV